MLKLATAELPWAVVDDFEIRHDGPSYSWQTAEAMVAKFPGARLFWIMGVDQWRVLPQWARAERLAECVEFIVSARGEKPEPRRGFRLHALDGEHPAAATLIRAEISRGAVDHPWLDPAVSAWIRQRGLYQGTLEDSL
jgi:nicotinate-nucleotide adenylyltransferase